jgi:outer membrane protein assembly factor BamA
MWVQLRWGLLALFVSLISPCLLCVQSQECVDQSSAVSHQSRKIKKKIKINIVGVEFRGENSLSDAARTKLAETIQRSEIEVSPEEPDTHWANVLRAQSINEPLHAQGYFMASTEVTPYLVKAEPDQYSYIVSFTIENGPQYRVGTLQIVEATAFTPTELMKQIHLSPGEVFDDDKIWQGIESMKRLYGAKGYIDMTAEYSASTHQIHPPLIDVSVQVVEGRQYRVGTVQILGLSARAENLLKSVLEPGQIFDSQSFTDFLKEERGLLPVDASDNDITMGRNLDDGTLQIALDFRRCPGHKIPFPPVNVSAPVWGKSQLMALPDRWFHVSDKR